LEQNEHSIWKTPILLEALNDTGQGSMGGHIGIEFIEVGPDYLVGRMPVDHRTVQPYGLLHGGASVALAETLGSTGAMFCVDQDRHYCVGLEINANHIRSARQGWVIGIARPVHIGRSTQVWEIRIQNEQDKLVSISRLTMAVLDR
jgi:1,4-dihydroxy-2-naphthoyl-CoA hydrolase